MKPVKLILFLFRFRIIFNQIIQKLEGDIPDAHFLNRQDARLSD